MAFYWCVQVRNWLSREEGQDVVEYSVLVVFIVLIALAAINLLGLRILVVWQDMVVVRQERAMAMGVMG